MGFFIIGENMRFAKVVDRDIDRNDLEKIIDKKASEDLKIVDIVDVGDIKVLYFEEFLFNE